MKPLKTQKTTNFFSQFFTFLCHWNNLTKFRAVVVVAKYARTRGLSSPARFRSPAPGNHLSGSHSDRSTIDARLAHSPCFDCQAKIIHKIKFGIYIIVCHPFSPTWKLLLKSSFPVFLNYEAFLTFLMLAVSIGW